MSEGSKYNKDLSTKDIAKLIREDIKKAKSEGIIPANVKTSVKTSYGSCCCSIDVYIRDFGFNPFNLERIKWDIEKPNEICPHNMRIYNPEATEIIDKLEDIREAYNYNNSDPQSDYFDVNFYGETKSWWEYDSKLRNEAVEFVKALLQSNSWHGEAWRGRARQGTAWQGKAWRGEVF